MPGGAACALPPCHAGLVWLTPHQRERPGASAHQFAVHRVAVGLAVLCLLGAAPAPDVLAEAWHTLPRLARAGLRLAAAAAGIALALGLARRATGPLTGALALTHGLTQHVSWDVAGPLVVASVLATAPAPGEPWSLSRRDEDFAPAAHWTTAAWTAVLVNTAVVALTRVSGNQRWAVLGLALALGGSIFVRGPRPILAWSALGLLLLVASLGGAATILAAWLPAFIGAITHDWLPPKASQQRHPIVFYDGVCAVCDWSTRLIISEDTSRHLKLAPLQGSTSRELLGVRSGDTLDSIVLLDGGSRLQRSAAALRIAAYMGGMWRLVGILQLLPNKLLDAAYDLLANNRYDWFGKLEACRVPTPEERKRFLD